jgi:hypothetical protein
MPSVDSVTDMIQLRKDSVNLKIGHMSILYCWDCGTRFELSEGEEGTLHGKKTMVHKVMLKLYRNLDRKKCCRVMLSLIRRFPNSLCPAWRHPKRHP